MKRLASRFALAVAFSSLPAAASLAWAQQPQADAPPAPKLTKPPKLITFVEAEYPAAEKAAGKAAAVVLKVAIGEDGKVIDAEVATSGGPAFDAAAIAAVRKFIFEPAEIDGKPAPIRILYKYDFVIKQEAKTTADFSGVVRDRKKKKPLAGVVLEIGKQKVVTDATGRFVFKDLPPGKTTVRVSGEDITAVQTSETLEAAQALDVVYDVTLIDKNAAPEEKDDLEIVVVAPPIKRSVASVQIVADQGRKVPGTTGDVLKVVESLPGVARATVGSGALVLWGASPQDSRVYVDGVRIPALYHVGGLRSVVATDLVRSLELVPGGYAASFGRAIGGLVLVDTDPLAKPGNHGVAQADILDASGAIQADVGKGRKVAVFGRRSHLGELIEASERDVGELFPIPRYWDAQLRVTQALRDRERIEITGLASSDDVVRTAGSADPSSTRRDERKLSFYRLWLRYHRELKSGGTVTVVPWFGIDRNRRLDAFGDVTTEVDSRTTLGGVRAVWREQVAQPLTLSVGLDAEVERISVTRRGSIGLPAREGDIRIFGQPPPDQVNFDTWNVAMVSPAPFIEGDLALFKNRLHILPGLRLDPFFSSASRRTPREGDTPSIGVFELDSVVQPRLALRAQITDRWSVNAAWGIYRQQALAEDRSAVFGNPLLPLARAMHYVAGTGLRLTESLSTEVTVFLSESEGLSVRNPVSTPPRAEALVPIGTGRAYGAQILARKELTSRAFGWVSYSLLRSERVDRPDGPKRLFDYDQTHILTAVASWNLGAGFELGARFRYTSGFPRTPVVGRYYDARRDLWQPVFGAHNSIRLPAFYQLDVRLSKRFRIAASDLEVYVDVQNVTDRDNAEEIVYSSDFTQRGYIRGLPLLPVAGARWSF